MAVLTETIVELLDRHTAIDQFRNKPKASLGLSMISAADVRKLHESIREHGAIDIRNPTESPGIRRLLPGYENHKFWHRVLGSRNFDAYASMAWEQLLPILAEPAFRVAFATNLSGYMASQSRAARSCVSVRLVLLAQHSDHRTPFAGESGNTRDRLV